jgi:hypothetical protein
MSMVVDEGQKREPASFKACRNRDTWLVGDMEAYFNLNQFSLATGGQIS